MYAPYASEPALLPGETAEQRAERMAQRRAVADRMSRLQIALARLQAMGIAVRNVEATEATPIIEVAPTWRCGQLHPVRTIAHTPAVRVREAVLHGCRVQWGESLTVDAMLAIA